MTALDADERAEAVHRLQRVWEYQDWDDERWNRLPDAVIATMLEVEDAREATCSRLGIGDADLENSLHAETTTAQNIKPPCRLDHLNGLYAAAGIQPVTYQFTPGGQFIFDQPSQVPALWGDSDEGEVLWAEGESLMVAGGQGLGKTTLAGLLIRAQIRGGGTVLGLPVADPGGKILYLAMDRPRQIARAFARQFDPTDRATVNNRLAIWQGPPPADIAQNPQLLTDLADAAGATVVYIDSVKDAAVGVSEDAVGAGYNRARQMLIAGGRQVCDLHHIVKSQGGQAPYDINGIYGSTWLTSGAGSVILLTGEPGDPIVSFRHVKQPANEVGPYRLLHDQDTGTMTVEHGADLLELAAAGGANGITAVNAAIALFDTDRPTRANKEKAKRKLDKLVNRGLLVRIEGARGGPLGSRPASYFPATAGDLVATARA